MQLPNLKFTSTIFHATLSTKCSLTNILAGWSFFGGVLITRGSEALFLKKFVRFTLIDPERPFVLSSPEVMSEKYEIIRDYLNLKWKVTLLVTKLVMMECRLLKIFFQELNN